MSALRRLLRRPSSGAKAGVEVPPLSPCSVSSIQSQEDTTAFSSPPIKPIMPPTSYDMDLARAALSEGGSDSGTARTSPDPLISCKSNTVEEELREALIAHDSLTQTVQGFYKKIQKQAAQIEVYERLLMELHRLEGEEEGSEGPPPQHEPDLWSAWELEGDDEDQDLDGQQMAGAEDEGSSLALIPAPSGGGLPILSYPPRINSAVASARLTSQIIEELHASQREIAIQSEEKSQLEERIHRVEVAHAQLVQDKEHNEKIIVGLRAEIRLLKLQIRAHRLNEAKQENGTVPQQPVVPFQQDAPVSLPLFRSISAPNSHGPEEAPSTVNHTCNGLDDRPLQPCSSMGFATTPTPAGQVSSPSRVEGLWDTGHLQEELAALLAENKSLRSELEATQHIAAQEINKRVALEKEVSRLRKLVEPEVLRAEANGADGAVVAPVARQPKGKDEVDDSDVVSELEELEPVSLVLKEELTSLRALNPDFVDMWGASETPFKVRGVSYMTDGVKVDTREPLFELIHVEIFDVETGRHIPRAENIAGSLPDGLYAKCQDHSHPPYLLVLNFQVPGVPSCSVVVYFALKYTYRLLLEREIAALQVTSDKSFAVIQEASTAAGGAQDDLTKALRLLAKFITGDEVYRNSRFKLIPSMVEGPWVVRTAVGTKPVILGKKLTQRYATGPGYMEVDVDIGSSSIASRVLALVRDYSKHIVVEVAILLQGESEEELPEWVLGSVKFSHVDWSLGHNLRNRLLGKIPPADDA